MGLIMGTASQRLGERLRSGLFEALILQDVSFFDDNRTGDILSRIGSDTQVVQDGLTQSVASFIKNIFICVGMIVIMFTYSTRLTFFALLFISPSLFANNIMWKIFAK